MWWGFGWLRKCKYLSLLVVLCFMGLFFRSDGKKVKVVWISLGLLCVEL